MLRELIVEAPAVLESDAFDRLLGPKFEQVAAKCARSETRDRLERMRDETRERLVGRTLPLACAHADLRSKHVQVDAQGALLGILDWGTCELRDLPCFDLSHFVIHEWKQAADSSPGEAWRRLLEHRDEDAAELEVLQRHARAVGIESEVQRALEAIHPVIVGAMAEGSWEYSRPRWIHESYGL